MPATSVWLPITRLTISLIAQVGRVLMLCPGGPLGSPNCKLPKLNVGRYVLVLATPGTVGIFTFDSSIGRQDILVEIQITKRKVIESSSPKMRAPN